VGALDVHYTAVLRSGWEAEDLAVAISCSNSPTDHIQRDNGTLVVGTRGHWLIADPGYQQYARETNASSPSVPRAQCPVGKWVCANAEAAPPDRS